MILARIFTKIYKESGIILIDATGKKYICGNPRKENPITIKLLKGLELGCSGCISAVTNVTHSLARKVFDDFENKHTQIKNNKLIDVRETFDQYNLISALHSFLAINDEKFKNILPPLILLSQEKQKELVDRLNDLKFISEKNLAA